MEGEVIEQAGGQSVGLILQPGRKPIPYTDGNTPDGKTIAEAVMDEPPRCGAFNDALGRCRMFADHVAHHTGAEGERFQ